MQNSDDDLFDPNRFTGTSLHHWGVDMLLLHTEAASHVAEFPMGAMPW